MFLRCSKRRRRKESVMAPPPPPILLLLGVHRGNRDGVQGGKVGVAKVLSSTRTMRERATRQFKSYKKRRYNYEKRGEHIKRW